MTLTSMIATATRKIALAIDVDLRRQRHARLRPRRRRGNVGLAAGVEVRDHEVVDREGEAEQRGGEDRRRDQRQRHLAERRPLVRRRGPSPPPRGGGRSSISRAFTVTTTKLTMNITCAMKIVMKPARAAVVLRKSVRSDAPSTISGVDIGRKTSRFVEPRPRKLVPDERERDQRPEHGRDDARERARSGARSPRSREARDGVPVDPVVEREALPDVVEAARRVVEREDDHDRDRQQQVATTRA